MDRKFTCIVFASTLCLAACEHGSYSGPPKGPEPMNQPSQAMPQTAGQQQTSSMASSSPPSATASTGESQMAMGSPQASSSTDAGAAQGCGPNGWGGGGGPMRGGRGMGMGMGWGRGTGGMGAGMGMGWGMAMNGAYSPGFVLAHSQELGLSDDQIQKIRKDMFTTHEKAIDLRARSMKDRAEVNRLLSEPKADQAAIDKQIQDSANAMAEMRKLHVQAWLRTRAMLNADQIKKLDELWAQNMPRRAPWRTSSAD
jgi:Spy/CpxP family protein refolding chaperone